MLEVKISPLHIWFPSGCIDNSNWLLYNEMCDENNVLDPRWAISEVRWAVEVSDWIQWAATSVVSTGEVRGWEPPTQNTWRWGDSSEDSGSAKWLRKPLGYVIWADMRWSETWSCGMCLWHLHFELWPGCLVGKKFSAEETAPAWSCILGKER